MNADNRKLLHRPTRFSPSDLSSVRNSPTRRFRRQKQSSFHSEHPSLVDAVLSAEQLQESATSTLVIFRADLALTASEKSQTGRGYIRRRKPGTLLRYSYIIYGFRTRCELRRHFGRCETERWSSLTRAGALESVVQPRQFVCFSINCFGAPTRIRSFDSLVIHWPQTYWR